MCKALECVSVKLNLGLEKELANLTEMIRGLSNPFERSPINATLAATVASFLVPLHTQ
jgi:hypothetical protein